MARENPISSEVFAGLTYACRFCGLFEESVRCHKKARMLDPTVGTSVTHTYFLMGDYRHCLETYSGDIGYVDALALCALGYAEEAAERLQDRLSAGGLVPFASRYLQSLKALLSGDAERCREEVRCALADYYCGPEERFYLAPQVIRLGDTTEGFAQLEWSVRTGYFVASGLRRDPWLDSVRGLAPFCALVEAAGRQTLEARHVFENGGGEALFQ